MLKHASCWGGIVLAVTLLPMPVTGQELLPGVSYYRVLSRIKYVDPAELALTPQQYQALAALEEQEKQNVASFNASLPDGLDRSEQTELYREWRRSRAMEIEGELKSVLLPIQLDALIRHANESYVRVRINAPGHEGEFTLSFEVLHDTLKLSSSQQIQLDGLDKEFRAKLKEVGDELAQTEDELAEEYERRLIRVLGRDHGIRYQQLLGQPSKLAQEFTAQGRRSAAERPREAISITIVQPTRTFRLDEARVQLGARQLVLRADLEQDLVLVAEQEHTFEQIREVLEAELDPLSLNTLLFTYLGLSPQELDMIEQFIWQTNEARGEQRSGRATLREQVQLVEEASERAMETLLPYQQRRLREVALQYVVGQSGAKFPLRFPWVRQQVETTAEQNEQLDELIREHDEKLAELATEYQEKEAEIRLEAERALYAVLTDQQRQQLWRYINPPDWATEGHSDGR